MKKYKLIYSDEALKNLREIVAYIAEDNIFKAVEYRQGIEKNISNLMEYPYSGKQTKPDKTERVCFYRNHKIFYSVNELSGLIAIIYISHGAMKERE